MKRDFDLIRKILLDIQSVPANDFPVSLDFGVEYSPKEVAEHIELLLDADLLKGVIERTCSGDPIVLISGLTWAGHDFVEAAEQEAVWKQALGFITKNGSSVTFDLLKEVLKSSALKALGLS